MKSKAPLTLAEEIIMVLVFAVAAAICLQAFAYAGLSSKADRNESMAAGESGNAAEVLKACAGDFEKAAEEYGGKYEGNLWTISYDENWQRGAGQEFTVTAEAEETENALLGAARIKTFQGEKELFSLRVCWQEGAQG